MFLGQLYYYEKELDKVAISSPAASLLDIEIAGVDQAFISNIKTLSDTSQMLIELKERFIRGYELVLKENSLEHSLDFWKYITSPVFKQEVARPTTEFQQVIADWLIQGASVGFLKNEILVAGKLINDEQDFALFYGLHVLQKINGFLSGADEHIVQIESKKVIPELTQELAENPEIIVVASSAIEPLLININCLFVRNSDPVQVLKTNISKLLQDFESIKLILVDNQDLLEALSNQKFEGILISQINFVDNQSDNFFDDLVKKTLGIRLV